MIKILTCLVLLSISHLAHAAQLKVQVDDCGPLARDELGVVFSLKPYGHGKTYFSLGSAYQFCPKLTSAKYVLGYAEDLCKNYKPRNKNECGVLKVFVIQEYINK